MAAPAVALNPLREGAHAKRTPDPCTMVIFGATGDLWHQVACSVPRDAERASPAITRAHVLNFVAYANDEIARQAMVLIDHLATQHPSRTIIIVARETAAIETRRATIEARRTAAQDDSYEATLGWAGTLAAQAHAARLETIEEDGKT